MMEGSTRGGHASGQPGGRGLALAAMLALLAGLCALSVALGSRQVDPSDIAAALQGQVDTVARAAVAARIPRTVLAVLAGAALGLAGAVMQGVTRNPLADPGILGINLGASLAVAVAVAFFGIGSAQSYVWVAIAGAAVSAGLVHAIASLGRGGPTPLKLALAGMTISVAFSALVTAVMLSRGDIAGGLHAWQIGGVGGASLARIAPVLPFLVAGFAISLACAPRLNLLALGDETAAALGERVALSRLVASGGGILLCGAITAICGPIGFVGLVVPHLCRSLAGVDHRWLLPCSALAGACLLTAADIAGRLLARPSELDVGIVTSLIGAPVFIWIVRRARVRDL